MPVKRVSPIIAAFIILVLIQLSCSTSSITQKATEIVGVVIETAAVLPGEATQPPAAEVPIVAGPPTATPFVYSGPHPRQARAGCTAVCSGMENLFKGRKSNYVMKSKPLEDARVLNTHLSPMPMAYTPS